MNHRQKQSWQVTVLLCCCLLLTNSGQGRLVPGARTTAIVGGTLIDGNGKEPVADSVVLIHGNRITAVGTKNSVSVPDGAEIINAAGKTVLPGLINSNCHLTLNPLDTSMVTWSKGQPKAQEILRHRLQVLLMEGVTSIRDTTGYLKPLMAVKPGVDKDEIPASRLFIGGRSIASPDRTDFRFLEDVKANKGKEDEGYYRLIHKVPDDLRPIEGPEYNFWKISLTGGDYWGADNFMSDDLLKAIVQEGHRAGKVIDAHVQGIAGIRSGLAAGLDVMQHPNLSEPLPMDLIQEYAAKGVYVSPLQTVVEGYVEIFENPYILNDPIYKSFLSSEDYTELQSIKERMLRARVSPDRKPNDIPTPIGVILSLDEWRTALQFTRENLRKFIEAKTRVVMSTDCSSTPFNFVEMNWHVRELQTYVRFGMTSMEALQTATKNPGQLLRMGNELGTVETGKLADVIVVNGDPLLDMDALRHVDVVIKDGIRYK
jgi:imidazolonepropionase-like amidohydrolase